MGPTGTVLPMAVPTATPTVMRMATPMGPRPLLTARFSAAGSRTARHCGSARLYRTEKVLPDRWQSVRSPRYPRDVPRHRPGPNSYAIIEQGRVGQLLSSKPMDRRDSIEEAAGSPNSRRNANWRNPAWKLPPESVASQRHPGGSGSPAQFPKASGQQSPTLYRAAQPHAGILSRCSRHVPICSYSSRRTANCPGLRSEMRDAGSKREIDRLNALVHQRRRRGRPWRRPCPRTRARHAES